MNCNGLWSLTARGVNGIWPKKARAISCHDDISKVTLYQEVLDRKVYLYVYALSIEFLSNTWNINKAFKFCLDSLVQLKDGRVILVVGNLENVKYTNQVVTWKSMFFTTWLKNVICKKKSILKDGYIQNQLGWYWKAVPNLWNILFLNLQHTQLLFPWIFCWSWIPSSTVKLKKRQNEKFLHLVTLPTAFLQHFDPIVNWLHHVLKIVMIIFVNKIPLETSFTLEITSNSSPKGGNWKWHWIANINELY